ncbi:MAG: SMI1/KNR4 family protein [Chlamydiales bacterium]
MSEETPEYYSKELFHKVVALTKNPDASWDRISHEIPVLPRGWFELSHLSRDDRVEFTKEFWFAKLPFEEERHERKLEEFFEHLDDVEIYATQEKEGMPFEVHMIYSMQHQTGFFQGGPPSTPEMLETLQKQFANFVLPPDYLAFLGIHDGFNKYTDSGLIRVQMLARAYRAFQEILQGEELVRPDGQVINPKNLIPFYESFGLHSYQCFYADWYLEDEMGNLFFSEYDRTISNFLDTKRLEENLAFGTFLGWLVYYLEDIWQIE